MKSIGVLAVQGAFELHAAVLSTLGHRPVLVRSRKDLDELEGLILPGGESTAQLRALERLGLEAPLGAFVVSGQPILATCAGLVLIATVVHRNPPCDATRRETEQKSFGAIEAEIVRNGWGRQVDSFEARDDSGVRRLVFIRAPRILSTGETVLHLATFRGEPVLIRQGAVTATTYHPELSGDTSTHEEVFGRS